MQEDTQEWRPTAFFAPRNNKQKIQADSAEPICLVLHKGHYRGVALSSKQVAALYRRREAPNTKLREAPRAAGPRALSSVRGGRQGCEQLWAQH
eukprot:2043770-Alexandrium_andersonii.AAC.1